MNSTIDHRYFMCLNKRQIIARIEQMSGVKRFGKDYVDMCAMTFDIRDLAQAILKSGVLTP